MHEQNIPGTVPAEIEAIQNGVEYLLKSKEAKRLADEDFNVQKESFILVLKRAGQTYYKSPDGLIEINLKSNDKITIKVKRAKTK